MEPAAKRATCLRAGRGWCNILLPRVICHEFSAPVVQLDRIPGFEPGGCRFESCRVRHFLLFELFDVAVIKKPRAVFTSAKLLPSNVALIKPEVGNAKIKDQLLSPKSD